MNNRTLLSIIFVFTGLVAFAQDSNYSKKWSIGVIAGLQPQGKLFDTDQWEKTSGFIAGLSGQYHFSGRMTGFSVLLQPHYNQLERNLSNRDESGFWSIESYWKTESFNLPILLRYTIGHGLVRPFIEAGPNFKFRTSLTNNSRSSFCGIAGCSELLSNNNYQPLATQDRAGLIVSVGASVHLWKVAIPVSLRLNEGFGTYETKGMMYDTPAYDNFKTRTFQIVTGVTF
ncbi:hypothetical protein DSL64_12625 [Dyadobacter luteus]|uniref:Outer membrane protein beta-barrel domain-containing protein n=1 Tax=Dyadobacter luteus TaxID=2259619 RepID=A0A3D8YEI4_9BACT|nr:outer membrane beta-barrel protein [Dyadobacter luteus]REA61286.1 hypothetical protein DSL64_12625 [Dyadobacter luteus]